MRACNFVRSVTADISPGAILMKIQEMVVMTGDQDRETLVCPRFDRCSAPICPIDPGSWKSVYRKGEPICLYLRLRAKSPFWGLKAGCVPREIVQRVEEVYPEVLSRYTSLKRALKRVANSPQKRFIRGEDR